MERYHTFKLGLAVLFYVAYSIRPATADETEPQNYTQQYIDDHYVFYQGVQGKPGVDFPVLSHIPRTGFNCREIESGYYADLETDCQVFHICEDGRKISFLCPNGTIFDQAELICEWWFKVNCTISPNLYGESAEQLREDVARRKASRRVFNHGAVMRTEEHASVTASRNINVNVKVDQGVSKRVFADSGREQNKINEKEYKETRVNTRGRSKFRKSPESGSVTNLPKAKNDLSIEASSDLRGKKGVNNQLVNAEERKPALQERKFNRKDRIQLSLSASLNSQPQVSSTKEPEIVTDPNSYVNIQTGNVNSAKSIFSKPSQLDQSVSKPNELSFRREPNDSGESQITQETASFVKNSYNKIEQGYKPSTANPYPNHRETYSDIKTPEYYSTKIFQAISSVTPQYLTTQPLNSGKPFIGSQVGVTLTTARPQFNVGRTDQTLPTVQPTESATTYPVPTELFNVGRTDKTIEFPALTTQIPDVVKASSSTVPPQNVFTKSSFNIGDGVVKISATPLPNYETTTKVFDHSTVYGTFASKETLNTAYTSNARTPKSNVEFRINIPESTPNPGFYVTKNFISVPSKPRPFEINPQARFKDEITTENSVNPTIPAYKISSASPFTLQPTQPTPLTSILPPVFDNVDSMIDALVEMANKTDFDENPRPGLIVPPSVGPQTLHTLAVYFANALDGIAEGKDTNEENLTPSEKEKKRLTALLTKMTMDRYNELFGGEEIVTVASRGGDDLEGQHTKSAVEPPKVRQLAKVFTTALSSYLDDPATFKKVLEEVRPTEPPPLDEESTDLAEDELLNFSDTDPKSSYPPIFPTVPSARPTWGYLVAFNNSNSLSPDENLQSSDSQSFVSQFNKLQQEHKISTTPNPLSSELPNAHWTSSPGATKLWKTTFSFDPSLINENFGTTELVPTATEAETEIPPHHEIKYDLRALPKVSLNSTQVHGILIDFMNTTKTDDRLQRILKKLNTTETEFLSKMKEIEGNPLTRRLILLLISECGENATKEIQTKAVSVNDLLSRAIQDKNKEVLETSSSIGGFSARQQLGKLTLKETVDSSLDDDNQDTRALQLLNSLYTIASQFGK